MKAYRLLALGAALLITASESVALNRLNGRGVHQAAERPFSQVVESYAVEPLPEIVVTAPRILPEIVVTNTRLPSTP
jgi:hypothetical protein